jgi:dGTPase
LALVHDIGHPPFGHAGEKALDSIMRAHGLCFDHNLHALRIVEDFELRYAAFRGLNLTFEVREGIVKHSRDYTKAEFPSLSEYLLGERPPLEAQLIDAADEIAYNTADLDDGYEAHLLKLPQLRDGVTAFRNCLDDVERLYPGAIEKLKFNEALKRFLNRFVGDLIVATKGRLREMGIRTLEEVRTYPDRLVKLSPAAEQDRCETKQFLYSHLYFSPSLEPEKAEAEQVIRDMFDFWMSNPKELPAGYQEKARREALTRVVCDYIAGMTDTFILEQHARYFRSGVTHA